MNLLKWFKRQEKFEHPDLVKVRTLIEDGDKLTRGMLAAANSAISKLMSNADIFNNRISVLETLIQEVKAKDSTNLQLELDKARSEVLVLRQINDGWMKANHSLHDQLREAREIMVHIPNKTLKDRRVTHLSVAKVPLGAPSKPLSISVQPPIKTIADLNLSLRVYNMLTNEGIKKVSDLCKYREIELRKIDRFGITALNEVNAALEQRGLRLRG